MGAGGLLGIPTWGIFASGRFPKGPEKILGRQEIPWRFPQRPFGELLGPLRFLHFPERPGALPKRFLGNPKTGPEFLEALRNILGPPTPPKVSKRGSVESWEAGRDIPRIFSGREKQKQILPGETVRG
jgi:hypothetical protein